VSGNGDEPADGRGRPDDFGVCYQGAPPHCTAARSRRDLPRVAPLIETAARAAGVHSTAADAIEALRIRTLGQA
jgi:hypothetical protein